MLKKVIKLLLRPCGYVVRSLGQKNHVGGVDLLRDVQVILGNKRQATLFDVGANVGQTVSALLGTFTEPRIHAFEPSPATFEILKAAYGACPRVRLENLALSDREGALPFHVNSVSSVNDSFLEPRWNAQAKIVPVQACSLDRYCQDHKVETIDYLKIDAQGYDLTVLRGARKMLLDRRIRAFSMEIIFNAMYKSQPSYFELLSFAHEIGYKPLGFYDQVCTDDELAYLNALFVPGANTVMLEAEAQAAMTGLNNQSLPTATTQA